MTIRKSATLQCSSMEFVQIYEKNNALIVQLELTCTWKVWRQHELANVLSIDVSDKTLWHKTDKGDLLIYCELWTSVALVGTDGKIPKDEENSSNQMSWYQKFLKTKKLPCHIHDT